MGKDKLRKFKENETFGCLVQPCTDDLIVRPVDGAGNPDASPADTGDNAYGHGKVLYKDHPLKGHWGERMFGNSHPVVVELGCGKGEYTVDLALRNPGCNYIGVDIKGARLWKGAKYAHEHGLSNVAFLRTRIEFIEALFGPGEVSEIWITFADPQIGREKKRLTSPLFLSRYRNFLKKGGIVHLKTDSRYLHEYTRAIVEQNGLEMLACSTDIYGSLAKKVASGYFFDGGSAAVSQEELEGSDAWRKLMASPLASVCGKDAVEALFQVQTFYESQYLAQGIPITYLAFRVDHDGDYVSPDWSAELWER